VLPSLAKTNTQSSSFGLRGEALLERLSESLQAAHELFKLAQENIALCTAVFFSFHHCITAPLGFDARKSMGPFMRSLTNSALFVSVSLLLPPFLHPTGTERKEPLTVYFSDSPQSTRKPWDK
jgi:hypothetical protein